MRRTAAPSKAVLEPKAVVELFTSQGCSSCPTADAVLGRLVKRDDIVALSLPVDYWDYLGWKDTLASPKFSERQRAYAQARGDGAIYTPQVIVNGVAHVNGSDEDKIAHLIDKTSKTLSASRVPIKLVGVQRQAGRRDRRGARRDADEGSHPLARRDRQERDVPIERGENQGKTVTYTNVVRELIPIGMWNGTEMTVKLERQSFMRPGTDRCAVLLQQGHAGPIIGAALLKQF